MKMDVPNTGSLASFEGLIPKRNELPYYRKENNGYSSMLTNNGDYNYSMLNGTGNVILELSTGENSVHAILSKLQDKYPDVPEKTLFDDIVRVLHMLTQIDAISWRDKDMRDSNPFSFTASQDLDYPLPLHLQVSMSRIFSGCMICWLIFMKKATALPEVTISISGCNLSCY